ncbi:MAG: glycosyltransferase family A protein, partial [Eubacteriales bacterium]
MKNYSENTDEIMVSIFCLCYNHEKYLVKCLEGFVNQKTQFKFEVLVHDDASTDNSAKIIREFELKYPSIIKPIYQLDNQYSKGVSIGLKWQMSRAKGRYIAFCDGDDYWCDHNKLQKQFNIMEGNNNCHLCLHRVELIKESGEKLNRCCPKKKFKRTTWSTDEFFEIYLGDREHFQTSSYFIRR